MAKLHFYGAARVVTGSQYLLETEKSLVLIDCGLYQGAEENQRNRRNRSFAFAPADLAAVVLTHAHIDHSGLLPLLVKEGYRGPIFATDATIELCGIMLPDSGHLQEEDVGWENRHRRKRGLPDLEPLYTEEDARAVLPQMRPLPYNQELQLADDVRMILKDAGHILGSSCPIFNIDEGGKTTSICFSGDLGNRATPLMKDPEPIGFADYVVIESTYGHKISKGYDTRAQRLAEVVNETFQRQGVVLIPAFAVGRTQDIVFTLHQLIKDKAIPSCQIYVDSPMAIHTTKLYQQHPEMLDPAAVEPLGGAKEALGFARLHFTTTPDQSRALNDVRTGAVIISASGMCSGGRIRHHLLNRLDNPRDTILFVGYQAIGTPGRIIVDGAKHVSMLGKRVDVRAQVASIMEFSAHGDQAELTHWWQSIQPQPKLTFVTHGEAENSLALAKVLEDRFKVKALVPHMEEVYKLT